MNDKLFIIKVRIRDPDVKTFTYEYDSIFANDAEEALYMWNEKMVLFYTEGLHVIAVEVFSTQSAMTIEIDEADE